MDQEEQDRIRITWKTRIIVRTVRGMVFLVMVVMGIVIAFLAAPSSAGIAFGVAFCVIGLIGALFELLLANRIRKMGPEAWFATQPRPEDEPLGKMR